MSVREDFAFIIYCATFACYMVAYGCAWLNDDLPPRCHWLSLLLVGSLLYVGVTLTEIL